MTFCFAAEECVVFDRVGKIPGLSYRGGLCVGCQDSFSQELNWLRYDYVDLSQLIPKSDSRNDEADIFRPKPESSLPLSMSPFHLRARIAYLMLLTERTLRMWLGDSLPSMGLPVREGFALDAAVRYLHSRLDALVGIGGVVDRWEGDGALTKDLSGLEVLLELRRLHRQARVMCGVDSRTITVPGDCPACSVPSLRRSADDADKVWCRHCRMAMTSDDYLRRMRMQFSP